MQAQGKIQKWGNSSAIRLSAKVLAAAGITTDVVKLFSTIQLRGFLKF